MPRPWRSAALSLLLAAAAPAQTLNLGGPPEPPPRLELAMVAHRRVVEQELRRAEPGPAGAASQALRRLALALMARGEAPDALRDPDATQAALLGLTIARHRAHLDRALLEVRDAAALESAAALLASGGTTADVERALQRLFAEVRPAAGLGAGWIDADVPTSTPGTALVDLAGAAALSEGSVAAVGAMETEWQVRRATRAWGREAEALRADLAQTLGLLDPRRRLAPAARLKPWRDGLESVIPGVSGGDARAAATLARLAALGRLTSGLPTLRNPSESRRLVEALLELDLSGPETDARLRDAESAVASASRAFDPAVERGLVRELRQPFREVGLSTRESALAVVRAATEILTRPGAMSDPGVLSALNNHGARWDELDQLRALADLIREGPVARPGVEARVAEPFRALARRLVAIQRDVATPAKRDAAQGERRALVAAAVGFWSIPGEDALRAHAGEAVPGLERATGGHVRALLDRLDAERAAWLKGTTEAGAAPPAAAEARLRALARVVPLALDAAAWIAGGERLNEWPGWECGPEAWRWVGGDLEGRVAAACAEGARANAVDLSRRLDALETEHSAGLLAGALARAWAARVTPAADPVDAALAELSGPAMGPGAWMGRWRVEVARVCLIAEEAAALSASSDGSQARGQERLAALRRALLDAAGPVSGVR